MNTAFSSAPSSATPSPDLLLQAEGLTFVRNNYPVLSDLNMQVFRGECLALLGRNGSGKTTLLRILLGLLQPTSGRVRYFRQGHEVERLNMGYLPQQNRLDPRFPITVREVVASGLLSRRSFLHRPTAAETGRAEACLADVGLLPLADRPIGQISGGELQRALLARALAADPELLLLDEPGTYMDAASQAFLRQLLERQLGLRTLVVVTHNPEEILPAGARIMRL
ncbi:MAG: metal ABC transporter ATP-binding protein [Bacteroidaceae bacterium]|jgi:zinc transport system ATP-binding protein